MLSDATNLWRAMQILNENITTALEGLDQSDQETVEEFQPEEKDELEIYKKMLDDAQMQHFELSKQSRSMIAEKEAEILIWKRKYAELSGESVDAEIREVIDSIRITGRQKALEDNLEQAEELLRRSISEKNEALAKAKNYEEINTKYESLKQKYDEYVRTNEISDAQKTETIENLVSEYSKLAAEAEARQTKDSALIAELRSNNEVLTMKMHALEHSITELADRASSNSRVSGDASHELKELRARVVNLQYDVKEKDAALDKMKNELDVARTSSPLKTGSSGSVSGSSASGESSTNGGSYTEQLRLADRNLEQMTRDLENMRADLSRLQVTIRHLLLHISCRYILWFIFVLTYDMTYCIFTHSLVLFEINIMPPSCCNLHFSRFFCVFLLILHLGGEA